jgi:hypothetical protein
MMRFESFSHTERNTEQNMQYQRFSTERLWADTADLLFIRANFSTDRVPRVLSSPSAKTPVANPLSSGRLGC